MGESARVVKTTVKVVENADDVVDAANLLRRTADTTSDIRKATGSYEIVYESGKNYVGKGDFKRAIQSAKQHSVNLADDCMDRVFSIRWKSAPTSTDAFIDEYFMQLKNGVKNSETYNKIWSPGRKYFNR